MTVDVARELNRKLRYSYVKMDNGEICRIYGIEYSGDYDTIVARVLHPDADDTETVAIDEQGFSFKCPRLGYINKGKRAMYVSRQPQRQWRLGLSMDFLRKNALPKNMGLGITSKYNIRMSDQELADLLFVREFPDYITCINNVLNKGFFAQAFDYNWAVSLANGKSTPMLFYKTHMVGRVLDVNSVELFEHTKHMLPTLSKILPEVQVA